MQLPARNPVGGLPDSAHEHRRTSARGDHQQGPAAEIARAWRRESITELLSGASMLTLPLTACGTILGVFACTREERFRRFDAYDVEIGMDFASRATVIIDGRYQRMPRPHLSSRARLLADPPYLGPRPAVV